MPKPAISLLPGTMPYFVGICLESVFNFPDSYGLDCCYRPTLQVRRARPEGWRGLVGRHLAGGGTQPVRFTLQTSDILKGRRNSGGRGTTPRTCCKVSESRRNGPVHWISLDYPFPSFPAMATMSAPESTSSPQRELSL